MNDYPKFDLLSGLELHIIIVKLREDEEWIPFCRVDLEGFDDPTHALIDHLNATRFDPFRDAE